jgi:leucyl/phenylalanyl-tRNA---protein transferase
MFSKVSNSAKIALITLAEKLKEKEFVFIDCQVHTDHLESMGAKFVEWTEFKEMLNDNCINFSN